jgi:phosphatidylinositol alpha-1,6-mannosyltransferase
MDDAGRTAALTPAESAAAHEPVRRWLNRRRLMAAYGVFLAYAAVSAIFAGGEDKVWAIWAVGGYAAALLILWRSRARTAAALVSVAVAVLAPLLWLSVAYPLEAGMMVIDRSAMLLIHHGSPYLPSAQVISWLSYDPYLPVMTLFGLPNAAGLGGLAGNSGVWLAVGTVAVLTAAFWIAMPHRPCVSCRRDALLGLAVAVASPVIGLNLAVITTDPPVLAFMLLAFALAARPVRAVGPVRAAIAGAASSGAALGVACDLKSTAWLAVPVMAAMFASRDGARAAGRFLGAAVLTVVVLIAALAPATLVRGDAAAALVQNSVLFPLGLTHDKTPAESLLPGHLLTAMGTAGHVVSIGLLLAAGLAIVISLLIRPPRDVPAACWRLAIGLALIFLLGPDVRFGYFIYPLGLVGWLAMTDCGRLVR